MILFDTNVLIDAFDPSSAYHQWAAELLRKHLQGDGVAVNPVILAELCVGDANPETVGERLNELGVTLLDLPALTSLRCAKAYAGFLENRKKHAVPAAPRIPLPDFFIGAHAAILNISLATADVGRYATYYPEIQLITPDQ